MRITYWLILASFAVFAAELLLPDLLEALAFSPALLAAKPWTALTAIFVHADLVHLLLNMMVLFFFGVAVEDEVGKGRMLALFFAGAFAGYAFSAVAYPPDTLSVGASAGIFALVGMGMLVRPLDWSISPSMVPMPLILMGLIYAVYNAAGFATGPENISYAAHFGGLAVGLMAASQYKGWKKKGLLGVAVLLLILLAIPALLIAFGA